MSIISLPVSVFIKAYLELNYFTKEFLYIPNKQRRIITPKISKGEFCSGHTPCRIIHNHT